MLFKIRSTLTLIIKTEGKKTKGKKEGITDGLRKKEAKYYKQELDQACVRAVFRFRLIPPSPENLGFKGLTLTFLIILRLF